MAKTLAAQIDELLTMTVVERLRAHDRALRRLIQLRPDFEGSEPRAADDVADDETDE